MYIQGMAQQTQVFLLCIGFGFLLGSAYDIMRFVREIFSSSPTAMIIQDILFSIVATFSSFFFLLCIDDGKLRMYPYLGMIIGFVIWYFTLGIPVSSIFLRISRFLHSLLKSIFNWIKKIFEKTVKFIKKRKNKPSKPLENSISDSV